jgi:hypothetical protein
MHMGGGAAIGAPGRHHPVQGLAAGLQPGDLAAQPAAVDGRDPHRLAAARLGRQGQVEFGLVVQQGLFQQAGQGLAQAQAGGLGQRDAVPADVARGQHGHPLRGGGQIGQRSPAAAGQVDAILAEGEVQLLGGRHVGGVGALGGQPG